MNVVRKALQTLPEENYEVLRLLTAFLVQVSCSKRGQSYSSSVASALHQLFDSLLPFFFKRKRVSSQEMAFLYLMFSLYRDQE